MAADGGAEKSFPVERRVNVSSSNAPPPPQVTNGKNAMPAFGGRLSDGDIQNVASYVITTSEEGWE